MSYFIFLLAKLSIKILKFFGFRSTSFPGMFALKFCPDILNYFFSQLDSNPIFITGSNGKSTSAGILANILKFTKQEYLYNSSGANLKSGILTTFIQNADYKASLKYKKALFEVDEATLRLVSGKRESSIITVNNFFRDQLDRFGEMKTTISLVQQGIDLSPNTNLILNADDPNVCRLTAKNILYFGMDINCIKEFSNDVFSAELASCPFCEEDLKYNYKWLGQFGDYYCPKCSYKRPEPQIKIKSFELGISETLAKVEIANNSPFRGLGGFLEIKIPIPGLFNVYNALSAVSTAIVSNISFENIKQGIETYRPLFGRAQKLNYKNTEINLFLIKNPIGASEVLRLIKNDQETPVLIALNDNYADGRDISWIWDAHFEYLKDRSNIFTTGKRASDMAIRLKYAGVNILESQCMENIKQALDKIIQPPKKIYILPTYTALLELTKIMNIKY